MRRWASRPTVLGVVLFIASETVFFGLLIISYVHFFGEPAVASAARANLDPLRTGIFSLFLFSSSFTVWRAERSRRAQHVGRRRLWLAATIGLGAVFMFGQITEYIGLFHTGVSFGANLFASSFYTLTGFHGAHVLIGLFMLLTLLGLDLAKATGRRGDAAQQSVSIYWHFVDGIWVVIFSIVYLLTLRGILV